MATADRTFSFRAPADLDKRMLNAQRLYARLSRDPQTASHVSWEFEIALARRLSGGELGRAAFMRAVVEAFVVTVEEAAFDEAIADEMSAWKAGNDINPAEREGWLRAFAAGLDEE